MDRETIAMSHKEIDRVGVIRKVVDGEMKQRAAAKQLDLSVRQIKRLARAMRQAGPPGLVSKRRSRPGNNRLAASVKAHFIGLVR